MLHQLPSARQRAGHGGYSWKGFFCWRLGVHDGEPVRKASWRRRRHWRNLEGCRRVRQAERWEGCFCARRQRVPVLLAGISWLQWPFLPLAAQRRWKHKCVGRLAPRCACSSVWDCSRRRWPGPRARLRITRGRGKRVCSHTPQRQVFRKLPTQPCQNRPPLCGTHARSPAISSGASPGAAGRAPGGLGGRRWGRRPEARADLQPLGPVLLLLLVCPVPGLLGTFHLRETRRDLVSQGQSHEAPCWMSGPVRE